MGGGWVMVYIFFTDNGRGVNIVQILCGYGGGGGGHSAKHVTY
jgi:hypothetical protein